MKTFRLIFAILIMFVLVGCEKEGGNNGPTPQPIEKIESKMISNDANGKGYGETYLDSVDADLLLRMYADNTNTFVVSNRGAMIVDIAYIGKVKDIHDITNVPFNDLFSRNGVAAVEGGGYVIRQYNHKDYFLCTRLYVEMFTKNSKNEIIGCSFKVQYFWKTIP